MAALLVVGATACGGRESESVKTTTFSVPGNVLRPIATAPPAPIRAGATRIVRTSALIRQLSGPTRPKVVAVGDWTSIDDGSHLGALVVLRLARPLEVDSDLPYIAIPPDSAGAVYCEHPYAAGWMHERSRKVTELRVLVDIHKHSVVSVQTNATRGTRSDVPGKPHPTCS